MILGGFVTITRDLLELIIFFKKLEKQGGKYQAFDRVDLSYQRGRLILK
jgi:hypothetical protein